MTNPAKKVNSMRMIMGSIVFLPLHSSIHVVVSFARDPKNLIHVETPGEMKYATLCMREWYNQKAFVEISF